MCERPGMEGVENVAIQAPLNMVVHSGLQTEHGQRDKRHPCAGLHVMSRRIESTNRIGEAVVMQIRGEFILWPRIVVEDGALVAGEEAQTGKGH